MSDKKVSELTSIAGSAIDVDNDVVNVVDTSAGTSGSKKITVKELIANTSSFVQSGTGAVAETVQAMGRRMVFLPQYGAAGDGSTDDTTALQNALTAAAGKRLFVPKGSSFYKCTGRVTAPANTDIYLEPGAEIKWTATAATGTNFLGSATRPGIEITGNNFRIDGVGKITGPSSAAYVANEIGLFAKGTSTSARKEGIFIGGGIEFSNWGYAGVILQFVDKIETPGLHTHDCGHIGAGFYSCNHGRAIGVKTYSITPGSGGNAYGFTLSHDSTGYSTDPAIANQRLVANPFCQDWEVTGTAWDIPLWQGFDAHGGFEIRFHHMATYNCRHGVAIGGSSGDAIAYAGENNSLDYIFCTTKKRDGSATAVSATDRIGINISGGSTVKHRKVSLTNFKCDGFGDTGPTSESVLSQYVDEGLIDAGQIENWKGYGIYCKEGNGIISNVTLNAVASATNSECIRLDTSSAGNWDVHNVRHRPLSGTVSNEGLRVTSGTPRICESGNDFASATTPYVMDPDQTRDGSDHIPTIIVTGSPTTVSVAAAGRAPTVRVRLDATGISTIGTITGSFVGQIIILQKTDVNATTFDRTESALAGGANWVSDRYDTLTLLCVGTGSTKFVEIARSANS